MSRVKASKHELKVQRESLRRYERYLPTLRLKQQQLQMELRRVELAVQEASEDEARARRELDAWIEVWAEPQALADHLALDELRLGETSVAGVSLPTFEGIAWRRWPPPLGATPPWVDDALALLELLLSLRVRRRVLAEQRSLLADELRLTSQRVNLFEKVRIPAAQEALRVIRIALGDLQAAEVVRAKIAKGKSLERERSA
jgi:V/A-type H+/Na+-transporting ATPase subunit D